MTRYSLTTNQIQIEVLPAYDSAHSMPRLSKYVFSYQIEIKNNGDETIQIMRRAWVITDALNNIEYVEGEGVVGEQPVIEPGESYSYTSFCSLKTSFGVMKGNYFAVTSSGMPIKIVIPEFILSHPFEVQ